MSKENDKKLYNHFKELISGKVKTGNPVRDDLIVSDAERNLADLVSKRLNVVFEEVKTVVEVKEKKVNNSKGK